MELLEKLKKNYDKYSDNIIQKCNATKTIVSGMNSDRNLVYDPIVIKSEYLVSASLKNDFIERIKNFSGEKNCIYIFEICDCERLEDIKKIFDEKKKEKKENRFPFNLPLSNNANKSKVLYVGSKKGNLHERLFLHLGLNRTNRSGSFKKKSGSTYALYLSSWWKNEFPNIKITVFRFSEDILPIQLQFIEDTFSEMLCPLFGKKGSNSK
ncbi:hypothetical protein [Treponema vincentii]|uniref:hypothetical protein n=1 Tax=Treponema TaxID=157 RepID=UPI001BAFCE0A|nr:hypothetical protein [Treponema vincentii]